MVKPSDFGAPDAFVQLGTPCSSLLRPADARRHLPKFQGKTLPFSSAATRRASFAPPTASATAASSTAPPVGSRRSRSSTPTTRRRSSATRTPTRSAHGDRPFAAGQFTDLSVPEDATTGDDCGGNGWYGEQALDVEAVHGDGAGGERPLLRRGELLRRRPAGLARRRSWPTTRPRSSRTRGASRRSSSIDGRSSSTIDRDLVEPTSRVFKQGAVQGIGFFFSSGDDGDDLDDVGLQAALTSRRRSVGHRRSAARRSPIDRNDNRALRDRLGNRRVHARDRRQARGCRPAPFHDGAGGGFSQIFQRPWYQFGVVPASTTGRAVPDIAMDADPTTGMLVGETQNFSLAEPLRPRRASTTASTASAARASPHR